MTGVRAAGLLLVLAIAVGVAVPVAAQASDRHPTMAEMQGQVVCPSCGTTLERSNSPAATRLRAYVQARIDDGWSKQQILDGLVEEYGGDTSVLARPRVRGLGAVAWVVPLFGFVIAAGGGAVALVRWRRRGAAVGPGVEPGGGP